MMRITVFGATGGTGKEVIKQALIAGHHMTAFARTPSNVPMNDHANLTIIQGDALKPDDVAKAITGDTDAVINVLGHRRNAKQDGLLERSIKHIITAMKANNVSRLMALSGAGAWISDKDKPGIVPHLIRGLMMIVARDVLEDSEKMAEIIMQTNLDWTIPRGPRILDAEHTGKYRVGYVGVNSSASISYADIADFLVKEVEANKYLHDSPVVSY